MRGHARSPHGKKIQVTAVVGSDRSGVILVTPRRGCRAGCGNQVPQGDWFAAGKPRAARLNGFSFICYAHGHTHHNNDDANPIGDKSTMVSSLLPPPVAPAPEKTAPLFGHSGNGPGGGDIDYPGDDGRDNPQPDSERWATPPDAYRTASLFIIVSIVSVFATLTHVLESRWVHSKAWFSMALPRILCVNTALLLLSSLTIELARSSANRQNSQRCTRWLLVTLLLGCAFLGGQLVAWGELASRGLYVSSNPGSFFFYFLTATHALHLLAGIFVLAGVVLFAGRLARKSRLQTAVGAVALYWHFMDGLWLYLLGLLFTAMQR